MRPATSSTKPAPSPVSSSPSTLPAAFLEWKAKRAATPAGASANTATQLSTHASAAKHPHSTTASAAQSMQVTAPRPSSATSTPRHPTGTVAPSRPTPSAETATVRHNAPAAPASQPQPQSSALPPCPQGASCTRQNATHRANFSHNSVVAQPAAGTSAAAQPHNKRANEDKLEEEAGDEEDGWQTGRADSTTAQHKTGRKRLRRLSEDDEDYEWMQDAEQNSGSEGVRAKPVCVHGAQCYRVNPVHLRQYQHPLQTVGTMKAGRAR